MEFWPGVIIQRGFLTRGQNSTWNFDPGSQFNVEFWPVYISSTRGIATQNGVKIQQRDQNSTAKEGPNSTKNPLNIDPGSVFNRGVKILSYTGRFRSLSWFRHVLDCNGSDILMFCTRRVIANTRNFWNTKKEHLRDIMQCLLFKFDNILSSYKTTEVWFGFSQFRIEHGVTWCKQRNFSRTLNVRNTSSFSWYFVTNEPPWIYLINLEVIKSTELSYFSLFNLLIAPKTNG